MENNRADGIKCESMKDYEHCCLNINTLPPFFFYSCYFSALLPIIDWYHIQYNDIFINYLPLLKKSDSIIIDYVIEVDLYTILNQKGLQIEERYDDYDIINATKRSICDNKPVIIWSDSFYQPNIEDTFNSVHNLHCFLVKGFEQNRFITIDHPFFTSMEYKESFINEKDFINCVKGYLTNNKSEQQAVFSSYSLVINDKISKESYLHLEYIANVKKHLKDILSGIKYLDIQFFGDINALLDIVNGMINYKSVITSCFNAELNIYNLADINLTSWKNFRVYIVRAIYTDDVNLIDMNEKIVLLRKVEYEYYQNIICEG